MPDERRVVWRGQTLKDLRAMPEEVQDSVGFALSLAQFGGMAEYAQPMKGNLRDVIEVRTSDDDGEAYRAMYTTTLGDAIYVLHVFHKKAKAGIATPRRDLETIAKRLTEARNHYAKR